MATVFEQLRRAASTQMRWSTLAHKEGRYNAQQAARDRTMGNDVLAQFHENEAKIDQVFSDYRRSNAEAMKETLRQLRGH